MSSLPRTIKIESATQGSNHKLAILLLAGMALLQFLLHVPMLDLPPVGQHVWRQVVGYAAARNYFLEDARFFFPRADIRLWPADTGAIYHEFPITYWLTAMSYRWFGIQNITSHLIPLLFNLWLIPGSYFLGCSLGYGHRRSLWLAFFMSFSPLFFYYAPLFEPNLLGLSFFVWGLGFSIYAARAELSLPRSLAAFAAGSVMLCLGTLCKPTYLFFGLPLLVFALPAIFKGRHRIQCLFGYGSVAAVVLVVNALVIKYAQTLYDNSPPQRQVHTPIGPAETPANFAVLWDNIATSLTKWFPEMNTNLAALPFFLCGLFLLVRDKAWQSRSGKFWLLWCLSFLIFSCFFIVRFADHDYYITASLPLAAIVSSYGAEAWLRLWRSHPKLKLAGCLLVLTMVVVATDRGYGRWLRHPQVPKTLIEHGTEISSVIPENELVLIQGDSSPIVYLYYLQRKGLSLNASQGNLSEVDFKQFKWLVVREPVLTPPVVNLQERFHLVEKKRVGEFVVYTLESID